MLRILVAMKSLQSVPLLIAVAAVATTQVACAQDKNNGGQIPSGMKPGVRYTTGAVTTAGWEKVLTENDPNLARWNWSAMTSYTQSSYGKVPAGHYLRQSDQPRAGIYIKPIHVSPESNAQKRIMPKPVQIARRCYTAGDVSAKVSYPLATVATPVAAKSYNLNYSSCSGKLVAGNYKDQSVVYGKIVTH